MAGGQHVLSKYPIESLAWEPALSEWFPGWIFKIDSGNPLKLPIVMLGVHLRPPLSTSSWAPYGIDPVTYFWTSDKDHQRDIDHWSKILWQEVEKIQQDSESKEEIPVFVLGDFNEEENGSAYKYLEASALRDARKEFDGKAITWTWPVMFGYNLTGRYDHLFYRPSVLKCTTASVVHKGCSDHYPVVGEFVIKPKEEAQEPPAKGPSSFHS